MRSMLVTIMLIITVVMLYTALFGGDDGLMDKLEQREERVSERIMRLNP